MPVNTKHWVFNDDSISQPTHCCPIWKPLNRQTLVEPKVALQSRSSCSFWGRVSYFKWHLREWRTAVTHQCGLVPPSSGFLLRCWDSSSAPLGNPTPGCSRPRRQRRKKNKTRRRPTHMGPSKRHRRPLCDWTITATLNLLWMATSTFLARRRACMFDSSPLTPIKSFCRWSQRRWAKGKEKQPALLSRQNGFHHSVHIVPLICLLHAGEEPGGGGGSCHFYQRARVIGMKWDA